MHTVDTTVGAEGWIRINISDIGQHWTTHPEPHQLLYVTIQGRDERGRPVHATMRDELLLSVWDQRHRPFITAYLKSTSAGGHTVTGRTAGRRPNSRQKRSGRAKRSSDRTNPLIERGTDATVQPCALHAMYIDFHELRLADVIMAPPGYPAYFCSGHCKFPAPHSVGITNHAIVQTLAHLRAPHQVPLPCCAAKKYAPISVIFVWKDSIHHLKKFPQMMVTECQCQ